MRVRARAAGAKLPVLCALLACALPAGVLPACAGPAEVPARNILMFDRGGRPVDSADGCWLGGYAELDEPAYERHVDEVLSAVRAFAPAPEGPRRVLIYVHGGLNEQPGTVQRAAELRRLVESAGYYPIFINWHSSLPSSYWERLWWVRQGADRGWGGTILAPAYFAADVTRGVFRLPMVWWWRVREAWYENFGPSPERAAADRVAYPERSGEAEDGGRVARAGLQVQRRESERDDGLPWWDPVVYALTLPVKIVGTLVVDVGGTPSWEVMQRRVTLLFEHEEEHLAEAHEALAPLLPRASPLMRFMGRLGELQQDLEGEGGLEVTLVGHSMGTMVANRLLQRGTAYSLAREGGDGGDIGLRVPRLANVVYMAAACSVREYEASVFPYLARHPSARVYHQVLDPDAEVRETNLSDLAPRGSLLVWIDDFLANPLTLADRTAGRYENLLPALHHTPPSLRERIFVMHYDDGDPRLPQRHGDFDDALELHRFWDATTWWDGPAP